MEVLNRRIEQRRENHRFYKEHLKDYPGITFLEEPGTDYFSNHWLTCIQVNFAKTKNLTRENIRRALDLEKIESRLLWKPMHKQPVFKDYPYYGTGVSDELFENRLRLPSGSNLTGEDKHRIIGIIKNTVTNQSL